MGGSATVPRCDSEPIESTPNIAGTSYSRTLENYIDQSHVSSRWQQNRRPILFCIEILRSIIVEFARWESLGVKHGSVRPEHITIDYDNELTFNIPPPICLKRQVECKDLTYREAYEDNLVIELLGDPKMYGGEECSHFLQTLTSIKRFKNLLYHPLLQSSMEKFYFPYEAKIWLARQNLCPEWETKWRNCFKKDRPYYKYTMEQLKHKIKAYSKDILGVVLDMESEKQNKWEGRRVEMGAKQHQIYLSKKNRVDVITIFNIVWNITEHINDQQRVMTQFQVVEAIQTLFPGFLLDLYDFLTQIDDANLDFLHRPSTTASYS